jgi:hypothetical protein
MVCPKAMRESAQHGGGGEKERGIGGSDTEAGNQVALWDTAVLPLQGPELEQAGAALQAEGGRGEVARYPVLEAFGMSTDDPITRAVRAAADEIAERIEKGAEEAGEMEWQLGASEHRPVSFSSDVLFEIIVRHILRNAWTPIIVLASQQVALMIILESSLSFIGAGAPATSPSWGSIVADGRDYVLSGNWWLTTFPGLGIAMSVLAVIHSPSLIGVPLRMLANSSSCSF